MTGHESHPALFKEAQEHLATRIEWAVGAYDDLPFEDNSFDYVTLLHNVSEPMLQEALRVARRGVLLGVANQFSFTHSDVRCHSKRTLWNPFTLWRLAQRLTKGLHPEVSLVWGSVAHCSLLKETSKVNNFTPFVARLQHWLNGGVRYSPLGATFFMRIDLGREEGFTPLLLKTKELTREQAQVMQGCSVSTLNLEKRIWGVFANYLLFCGGGYFVKVPLPTPPPNF